MNITVVFPGQGTQYVGMGKQFADHPLFTKANQAIGFDLKKIMLDGPADELTLTQNTQPAILTHSLILWDQLQSLLQNKNISVERVLGHSVGEYAALTAAGALSFEDALKAVHFRGTYMQQATPSGVGTMYAILKQPESLIRQCCEEVSGFNNIVSPANFNEPNQIVISGHQNACEEVIKLMEKKSNSRVKAIQLMVSAPFHCPLMKPAEIKLKAVLDQMIFHPLKFPYIANIDAHQYGTETGPQTIKENLLTQVCASVLWSQSIQSLNDDTLIVECGPGKVLAGLIKKINPNLRVISLDSEIGFSEVGAL
jgi:[acyl-carrier-protein] S-malonyltransferase